MGVLTEHQVEAALRSLEEQMKEAFSYIETWLNNQTKNTGRAYGTALKKWQEFIYKRHFWFPYRHFLNPKRADVEAYIEALRSQKMPDGRPLSPNSIKQRFFALKAIYSRLVEGGYTLAPNPWEVDLPELQDEERRPKMGFSQSDIRKMLNCWDISYHDRMKKGILTLLFGCALRRSEVVSLLLEDVYFEHPEHGPHLVIRRQKNKKIDRLPIQPWAVPALQTYKRVRPPRSEPYFFVKTNGKQISDTFVYRAFRDALDRCGFDPKRFSPHSARRSAITLLLDEGVPHRDVQAFSRHSSIAMVERYDVRKITPKNNPGLKLKFGGES